VEKKSADFVQNALNIKSIFQDVPKTLQGVTQKTQEFNQSGIFQKAENSCIFCQTGQKAKRVFLAPP